MGGMELLQLYGPLALAVAFGLLIAWFVWGKGRTLKFIFIGTLVGLLALVIGWPTYVYGFYKSPYDTRAIGLYLGLYFYSLPAALCGAILGYIIEVISRRTQLRSVDDT